MKNLNNFLFLDIDGVVNTHMIYKDIPPHLEGERYIEKDGYIFDICSPSDKRVSNLQAVTWLDLICHKYNFKIVITSTWRLGNFDDVKEALYSSGLSRDIEIIGKTPYIDGNRGKEITEYLCKKPLVDDYIILDDDTYDLQSLIDNTIKVDTYTGINAETYNQICLFMDRFK